MVIQPASLWVALTAPVPPVAPDVAPTPGLGLAPSSVSSVQAPMAAGTNSDPTCNFLSPEQIQHMIEAEVHQSLSARFLPPSRDTSVRSVASTSPDRSYHEGSLSIGAPDSPAPSHVSHPSSLVEVEQQEPDLSEDEGLLLDQPSFTGLSSGPF